MTATVDKAAAVAALIEACDVATRAGLSSADIIYAVGRIVRRRGKR